MSTIDLPGTEPLPPDALAARLAEDDAPVAATTGRLWRYSREHAPALLVVMAVVFNLVELRSELTYVPLLNDGSIHAQMVRYATTYFRAGHLPLHGWYPYLGLGSPQFLHYQSLGAMLTGLAGVVIGPDRAFQLATYLLWSTFPISVYLGSRLFNWGRWASALAGAMACMLFSVPGVGFESTAYLWIGYGVWSQMFAMWTLPLAWSFSWRAIALRKPIAPAVLFIALTICFHYITGYIAILAVPIWVLIKPSELWPRFRRLALLGVSTFLVASWALVPLMVYGKWASLNESLQNTFYVNSYGARQVLSWLFTGQIFDSGRWPIITILAGIGLLECARRWRTHEPSRALVVIFVFSVVLFFGRPTLGPLINLLPRSHDLFLRRFMFGVQLAALFLAGIGAVALARLLVSLLKRSGAKASVEGLHGNLRSVGGLVVGVGLSVLLLAPGWTQLASYDQLNASDINYQLLADQTAGVEVQTILSGVGVLGPGRIYAGLPTNWGENFLVGDVPVFKYVSNLDYDVVGYTLRTASLMNNPEANFDETNPADYQIFGIRYLIIPETRKPPVPATFITQDGPYQLWIIKSVTGYFQLVDTTNPITENRSDIGANSAHFLARNSAANGLYPTVNYANTPAAAPTDPTGRISSQPAGTVLSQNVDLSVGQASVIIDANRSSVLVMKVSYDPGWQATLDGVPVSTEMIAPALVGVAVGAGTHEISFRYVGYSHYLILLALGAVTFLLCIFGRRWQRRLGLTGLGRRAGAALRSTGRN